MHRPVVYLSKDFLVDLEAKEPAFRNKRGSPETGEFIPVELKTLERIFVLLLQADLLTDYDEKEAVKLYKQVSAKKEFKSFGELILQRSIKQNRFNHSVSEFSRYRNESQIIDTIKMSQATLYKNACYFLNAEQADCNEAASETGLSILGLNYDFRDFFNACTVSNYAATHEMNVIQNIAHPSNAIVIIDKFIFKDDPNKPPKLPGLIGSIRAFKQDNLKIKFELDIITKNTENNASFLSKANQLIDELGGLDRISLHIYAPLNFHGESDRFILSNYSIIQVGHPFDRDTVISSASIVSQESKENLIEAFNLWKAKLLYAKRFSIDTRNIGTVTCLFKSDKTQHRLMNIFG